jgi:hypothetical protein
MFVCAFVPHAHAQPTIPTSRAFESEALGGGLEAYDLREGIDVGSGFLVFRLLFVP